MHMQSLIVLALPDSSCMDKTHLPLSMYKLIGGWRGGGQSLIIFNHYLFLL